MAWTHNKYWDKNMLTEGIQIGDHYFAPGEEIDPAIYIPVWEGGKLLPYTEEELERKFFGTPAENQRMERIAEQSQQNRSFIGETADAIETVLALKALKELWDAL